MIPYLDEEPSEATTGMPSTKLSANSANQASSSMKVAEKRADGKS